MVEEVGTGRTIATEAWKESTALVISASARPDLVCLEVESELEAVLVIMVSNNETTFFKRVRAKSISTFPTGGGGYGGYSGGGGGGGHGAYYGK